MELSDEVVIIDDSPAILTILGALLKRHEFEAATFRTGELALEHLEKLEDVSRIKAIYCDISMPGMGGLAFLKAIRANTKYAQIKFVMISATVNKDLIVHAATAKVDGFLVKPITAKSLTKMVHDLYPNRAPVDQRKYAV